MSTKIYDGLRSTQDDADLFEITRQIADIVRPVFRTLAANHIMNNFIDLLDDQAKRDDVLENNVADSAFLTLDRMWQSRQQAMNPRLRGQDPYRFTIVFQKTSRSYVIANPYADRPEYREALIEAGLFRDWHYQNSSDREDTISEEEWLTRKIDWSEAENNEGTFADLPQWTMPSTVSDVFNYIDHSDASVAIETTNPKKRARNIIVSKVWEGVAASLGSDFITDRLSLFLNHRRKLTELTDEAIANNPDMPLPGWIKSYAIRLSDLPPVYEPPVEITSSLINQMIKIIEIDSNPGEPSHA